MSEHQKPVKGAINAVSFQHAMEWTERWQEKINPDTGQPYPKSYRFSKADFIEILNEENVEFIRIYPCVEDDNLVNMLVVGVDHNHADIIHVHSEASGIYNFATPCPNTCGTSPLNHDLGE